MSRWLVIGAAVFGLELSGPAARAHDCSEATLVQNWYGKYLHRLPKPIELRAALDQLQAGVCPQEVEAGILAGEEYFCAHGHTTDGFLRGLYQDVMGRCAYPAELQHWCCRMDALGCRCKVAREFLSNYQAHLALLAAQPAPVFPGPHYPLPQGRPGYLPPPPAVPDYSAPYHRDRGFDRRPVVGPTYSFRFRYQNGDR